MVLDVEDVIAALDPTEHRKVEEMADELIAEEKTLRERLHLTQVSVTRELGISQDATSLLEKAMGGSLSLIARFPGRPPVELTAEVES